MRALAVPFLLLSVSALAPLPAQVTAGGEQTTPPPRQIVMAPRTVVPLQPSGIANAALPVVEVMLNGKGPYRFGIETGAGFIGINAEIVEAVGLKSTKAADGSTVYQVDSLNIGAASFKDFKVESLSRSATGIVGILGLPFYHDLLLTIDYANKQLIFERDSLPAADGKDILPLTHAGPFWALPITLGGKTFQAVLDTRSTSVMSLSPEAAAPLAFEAEPIVVGRSGGAGIPLTETKAGRLTGNATIGRYTFPRPELLIRALPPNFPTGPLVGTGVLERFVVSLDQRHARIRFAHAGDPVIELPTLLRATAPASPAGAVPPPADLKAYVGQYGERTISLKDGKLFIQRPGGQLLEMVPTGKDAFGLSLVAAAKIEFVRDAAGKVTAIRVQNPASAWETANRTGG